MRERLLNAEGIIKDYGSKRVVDNLSIEITRGEIVGLLGPNGAGKSTTFQILYGAVIPTFGSIKVMDLDIFSHGSIVRRSIGVVSQENNLDPDLTINENLVFFARYCGLSHTTALNKVNEITEQLNLSSYLDYKPKMLSGGWIRRAMIARSLLIDPDIVFLDEPTTGLDPDIRQDFWGLLIELKHKGKAVLITTHYMEEASRLCDRIILMKDGKTVDQGTPTNIIERIVGNEVIEIAGIEIDKIRNLLGQQIERILSYGEYLVLVPFKEHVEFVVSNIIALNPLRYSRRKANLDDVFLILTGSHLIHE